MQLIKNSIEILSIHIPKTGGSSFQKTLQSAYGEDTFQRLDFTVRETAASPRMIATNRTSQDLLDRIASRGELASSVRILHGHFHYEDFARFFELNPGTKVLTWVRDPLGRIVSNYHYLIASFEREVQHTPLSRQLFRRLVKSLVEFAAHPRDVNLYDDYLRGKNLADYDFVGIIEDYDKELDRLGQRLGLDDIPRFDVNKAARTAPVPDGQQQSALLELNRRNLEIYHQAVALKERSAAG